MLKWILKSLGVIALVGVISVVSVGAAFAQDDVPAEPPGPGWCCCCRLPMRTGRAVMHELTEQTGLTRCAVLDGLAAGLTPAQVAEEAGVSPDDVVAGVREHAAKRLQEEVDKGHITPQWADELTQKAEDRAMRFMEADHSYLAGILHERACSDAS